MPRLLCTAWLLLCVFPQSLCGSSDTAHSDIFSALRMNPVMLSRLAGGVRGRGKGRVAGVLQTGGSGSTLSPGSALHHRGPLAAEVVWDRATDPAYTCLDSKSTERRWDRTSDEARGLGERRCPKDSVVLAPHADTLATELTCAQWHSQPMRYDEARAKCKAGGGTLATPASSEVEQQLLLYLRTNTRSDRYWAGVFLVRADEGRPLVSFDRTDVTTDGWNRRWNANPGDITGLPCCPGKGDVIGDPRCLVHDGWRDMLGVHPYPVTSCEELHPFFCEFPPETVDTSTGEPVTFTTKLPHVFFSPMSPPSVSVYSREKRRVEPHPCTAPEVIRPGKLRLLQETVGQALRHAAMSITPLLRGGSIRGSGVSSSEFVCMDSFFTWDLRHRMKRGGSGSYAFDATDLVILMTFMEDSATVWSFPCGFASDGRPNVVVMNIAPSHVESVGSARFGRAKLRSRVLQSLLHSLGFHEGLFHLWKQPFVNKTLSSESCAAQPNALPSCRSLAYLVTPAVKQFVTTEQFKCRGNPLGGSGTLPGAELEDGNLLHGPPTSVIAKWEKRIFRGELMTILPPLPADLHSDELPVLSGLTLAALQDTGWYRVNRLIGERLKWGWRQRCSFASDDCSAWPDRYKCSPTALHRSQVCSPDFLSLGHCNRASWPAGEIPTKFRWVSQTDQTTGGQDLLMDWCIFKEKSPGARGSCLVEEQDGVDCDAGPCPEYHKRGGGSRCFETTVRYKEYEVSGGGGASSLVLPALRRGTCLRHACVRVGDSWVVEIFVGGAKFACARKGVAVGPTVTNPEGIRTASNYTVLGDITCPDPREMCDEAPSSSLPSACNPADDCNSHGFCNPDGTCTCFTPENLPGPDPAAPHLGSFGFFSGPRCAACLEGYYPYPHCTAKRCPTNPESGLLCNGRGSCDGSAGSCACHANATHGYWAGDDCSACATGYHGGACRQPNCTSDASCGMGTCSTASGRCICYFEPAQGYWSGPACSRCADGYDINSACRVRIRSFFACDAIRSIDTLNYQPDPVDCTACETACGNTCSMPRRHPDLDAFGCFVSPRIPTCRANASRALQCEPCPTPSPLLVDCKGYPLLYTSCNVPDACGCLPAASVACRAGSSRAPPESYRPQILDSLGNPHREAANRSPKGCVCHDSNPAEMECGKPGRGTMVYFEPRWFQVIDEDFCHCTSPSVPVCSDISKPYRFKIRSYGTQQDCSRMRRESGCPNWSLILNAGSRHNATLPDLSVVDCMGWPPPRFSVGEDPCGCPFPTFTCREGTEGVCTPSSCPEWDGGADPIEVDCGGGQPPVSTLVGRHPCGCPPPPQVVCREGTGACCRCDYPMPDTIWVECKGADLDPPLWEPEGVFPTGNPWIQPCDPCPQCIPPPPVRRCIPGLPMRPAARNPLSPCLLHPLDSDQCIASPPSCPVDCHGLPPPQGLLSNECECPPPPVPACLPGTAGPADSLGVGTAAASTSVPMPCAADPSMCGAYACVPPGDLRHAAQRLGLTEGSHRRCSVREEVWNAYDRGQRGCAQACATDLDCACGFKCSVCGICRHMAFPDHPASGNCLLDGGASCGGYSCRLDCTRDFERIASSSILSASCNTRCTLGSGCAPGFLCNIAVHTPPPHAGAVGRGELRSAMGEQELGGSPATPSQGLLGTEGIPGFSASPFGGGGGDVPLQRDYGECVLEPDGGGDVTLHCVSHDDCGGYACGSSNRQAFFSASRCMSSCHVNSHCHPDFRCSRGRAVCLRVHSPLPSTRNRIQCADDPDGKLDAYGGCRGVLSHRLPGSNITCDDDLSRFFGFPSGSLLRAICPESCGLCARGTAQHTFGGREAGIAQSGGSETCLDDPNRQLTAFGVSDTQRCARVIDALSCSGDVGSLVDGIPPGTLVKSVCPLTCRICTPAATQAPPWYAGNSTTPGGGPIPDPCYDNHAATAGQTPEEKCRNQGPLCCYIHADSGCFTCNRLSGNPREEAVGRAPQGVLPDGGSCDLQPFDFCSPYACGGERSLPPPPGSECPGHCVGDEGCQPFFECLFPPGIPTSTSAATSSATSYAAVLQSLSSGSASLQPGRCVAISRTAARGGGGKGTSTTALLRIPTGARRGLQGDPHTEVGWHPAFAPPPSGRGARGVGSPVGGSATACHPYTAVQPGITQEQIDEMRRAHPGAGTPGYPTCRHSCLSDAGCAAGFFCTLGAGGATTATPRCPTATTPGSAGCLGRQGGGGATPPEGSPRITHPAGVCLPKRGLGAACSGDMQCATSFCTGGVCCNARCSGPCRTCDAIGICGWAPPQTNPLGGCPACELCDYTPDVFGRVNPASPLACTEVPLGMDPNADCGAHAVCNGAGGCMAVTHGWGSRGSCAAGFEGPDCATPTVHHRESARRVEGGDRGSSGGMSCSVSEIAHRSGSPFTGEHHRTASSAVQTRSENGFAGVSPIPPQTRPASVVDRRPRQFARRVLGVSHHSEFPCSNILGEPRVPTHERLHGGSQHSWGPRQHHVAEGGGGGAEVNPHLRYSPYVSCPPTQSSCEDTAGCRWVKSSEGRCVLDGSIETVAEAELACMLSYGCQAQNITSESCVALWGRCSFVVNGKVDPNMVTPLPLEWIELEFSEAVEIESVVLYENSHPGSLVRVDIQQDLSGSAAYSVQGGAVRETDSAGNPAPSRKKSRSGVVSDSETDSCSHFTQQGVAFCNGQVGCLWDFTEFQCREGTKCSVVKEECDRLEQRGECYWNVEEKRCLDGSPCTAAGDGVEREAEVRPYCNSLANATACGSEKNSPFCLWVPQQQSGCLHWKSSDECARHTTPAACKDQRRGRNAGLIPYCSWNSTTDACSENPAFHTCSHRAVDGFPRGEVACNATQPCVWGNSSALCVASNATNSSGEDGGWGCSAYSAPECVSCAYSSEALGCNPLCVWGTAEVQLCEPRSAKLCSALEYGECSRTAVCQWRGQQPVGAAAAGRRGTVQQSGVQVSPEARLGTAEADVALSFTGMCSFAGEMVSKYDLTRLCEGQLSKEGCKNKLFDGLRVCNFVEGLAPLSISTIPRDLLSAFEMAESGDALLQPAAFSKDDMATAFGGVSEGAKPYPEHGDTAEGAATPPCELVSGGRSMNLNENPFVTVWERDGPNFPVQRRYRELHVDVGAAGFKSKVIRLYFAPISVGLSQVEAVAIVGRASPDAVCDGYVWASPLSEGVPSAARQRAGLWEVPCSGRGRCGPRGCECFGNFFGRGCETCKFGFSGPACKARLPVGCTTVAYEDASQFINEEVRSRWAMQDSEALTSRVMQMQVYGSSVTSPPYFTSGQSHIRVTVSFILLDVPLHGGGCGFRAVIAPNALLLDQGAVVFSKRCPLYAPPHQ